MSPRSGRLQLRDGSFVEISVDIIQADIWRPHGFRYRLAWVQESECRILFDNHHGKGDHFHIGSEEYAYQFRDMDQLIDDFLTEIIKIGGKI